MTAIPTKNQFLINVDFSIVWASEFYLYMFLRTENGVGAAGFGHQIVVAENLRLQTGYCFSLVEQLSGTFQHTSVHGFEIGDFDFNGCAGFVICQKGVERAPHAGVCQGGQHAAVHNAMRIKQLVVDFDAAQAASLVNAFEYQADQICEGVIHVSYLVVRVQAKGRISVFLKKQKLSICILIAVTYACGYQIDINRKT